MNTLPVIGWAGTGNMGAAIAGNLLRHGYPLVVYNRTTSKATALVAAGARAAATPRILAEQADILFTMVSDDAAVEEIFSGEEGFLSTALAGKILVDMSTVSPGTSAFLSGLCREKGASFLDAPVSGSVKPAEEGTLIIMAGGSAEGFEKIKPIFDVIGKLAIHLGENGAGASAKLAINYLLALNLLGLAETMLFATKQGVRKEDMLTIINEGACSNVITKTKGPSILANQFPASFALKHLAKDLRLAGEQGLNTPLFPPLLDTFRQAMQEGLGEQDVMAVYTTLLEKNQ